MGEERKKASAGCAAHEGATSHPAEIYELVDGGSARLRLMSALESILRKEAISRACHTHELMDTDFVGNVTRSITVLDDDDLTFSQILCQPTIE
ncbi:MAG: hypothetical protein J0I75_22150, partial [Hyphomicrobium sp.]|nr:hypothetical protein [Hyphomicrobium sp.]